MADLARRSLLMAAPAIAVLATVPAFATETVNSAAWDAAMLDFREAEAANEAFLPGYRALLTELDNAVARVPHVVVGPDRFVGNGDLSTADAWQVQRARKMVTDVAEGRCRLDPTPDLQAHFQLQRQLAEAADDRHAQLVAIRKRIGFDEADDKAEALGDREYDARWALMNMPAPHLQALLWKLEYLLVSDESGCVSWTTQAMAQTVSDMRRLLGEA